MSMENKIFLVSYIFVCQFIAILVDSKGNICIKITQHIEYRDLDVTSEYELKEKTSSSEAFHRQLNSAGRSMSRGGGLQLGIKMFSIGENVDVSNAWDSTVENENSNSRFQSEKTVKKLEYNPESRQMIKIATTRIEIERTRSNGKPMKAPVSNNVKEDYVGTINREHCPRMSKNSLIELAKDNIAMKAKNEHVTISEDGVSLTETQCGEDGNLSRL